MLVEAELGRLSGTEDDLTVEDFEARLTDVHQVTYHSNGLKSDFLFLFFSTYCCQTHENRSHVF